MRAASAFSLLFLAPQIAFAVTPLGSWAQGIATNYGGAQDGLDPSTPSFGTKDVRDFSISQSSARCQGIRNCLPHDLSFRYTGIA